MKKEVKYFFCNLVKKVMFRGNIAKEAAGAFVIKLSGIAILFALSILLGRLLGPGGYGEYAYAVSWSKIVLIPAMLGLPILAKREVSRYKTLQRWEHLKGLQQWSSRVVILSSTVFSIIAACIFVVTKGNTSSGSYEVITAMAIVPLFASARLREGILVGYGKVVKSQIPLRLIMPFVLVVGVVIVNSTVGLTSLGAVIIHITAILISLLLVIYLVSISKYDELDDVEPLRSQARWFKSTSILTLLNGANMLNSRISVVMAGGMIGSEAAGQFEIARKVSRVIGFILLAVNMPLSPRISSLYSEERQKELQRVVSYGAKITFVIAVPVATGLIILSEQILSVFGNGFSEAGVVLSILCIGQTINVALGSVGEILNMTGMEKFNAVGATVAAVTNIILNWVLIPFWGINGAAISTAISVALWNVILAISVYVKTGLNPTAFANITNKIWTLTR